MGWIMARSKITASVLAASLAFPSATAFAGPGVTPGKTFGVGATGWLWAVFGCSGGIIVAAVVKNYQFNRPLTPNEAATCGFLFWFSPPRSK